MPKDENGQKPPDDGDQGGDRLPDETENASRQEGSDGREPPAWPPEWQVLLSPGPREDGEAGEERTEAQEPPEWPAEWQAPEQREPKPTPSATGDDPPAWPADWDDPIAGARPGKQARAQDGAPEPSPDEPDSGQAAPPPGSGAEGPPAWPEEWRDRGPGGTVAEAPAPTPDAGAGARDKPTEPLGWRMVRAVADPLLVTLGFRRMRERVRADYVPRAKKQIVDDDPGAMQRVIPYTLLVVLIALLALGAFWVFAKAVPGTAALGSTGGRETMLRAVSLLQQGDIEGARELRDRMHRADPQALMVPFFDGYVIASEEGGGSTTIQALRKPTWRRAANLRNLVTAAGYYEATGDLNECAKALAEASETVPRNAEVRLLRANVLLLAERYAEAIQQADALAKIAGAGLASADLQGRAYLGLGRLREAEHEFRTAQLYDDRSLTVNLNLADVYVRMNKPRKALGQLAGILNYESDNPDVHARIGVLCETIGEFGHAEAAYRKAIEAAPDHPAALNNLAYLLAVPKKSPVAALQYAERAHELAPDAGPVADTLGWIYHLLGRDAEALTLITKASALAPDNLEVKLHHATLLLAQGKRDEGVKILRGVAESPGDSKFRQRARTRLQALGE